MSLKIYEAYRVRAADPYELLWTIKQRGQDEFVKRILNLYLDVIEGRAEEEFERRERVDEEFQKWTMQQQEKAQQPGNIYRRFSEWEKQAPASLLKPICKLAVKTSKVRAEISSTIEGPLSLFEFQSWLRMKYLGQMVRPERNEWNFDARVNVRVGKTSYGPEFYLIPYCDRINLVGNFLDFMQTMEKLEEFCYWNNADEPDNVTAEEWNERGKVWKALLSLDTTKTTFSHWT
jgi:hypothetical protein